MPMKHEEPVKSRSKKIKRDYQQVLDRLEIIFASENSDARVTEAEILGILIEAKGERTFSN